MTNEGSTKPTYSELEAQVAFCEREMNNFRRNGRYQHQDVIAAISERVEAAETSLARVRGLLQRQSEVLQRVASWDFDFYGDCVAEAKKLASDALSQADGN